MRRGLNLGVKQKAVAGDEVNMRAGEPLKQLDLPEPMRRAAVELATSWDYEEAATKAGTTPEIVRGWTLDPAFAVAIGWIVIGLADNQ